MLQGDEGRDCGVKLEMKGEIQSDSRVELNQVNAG
jgi:hypothetical protein